MFGRLKKKKTGSMSPHCHCLVYLLTLVLGRLLLPCPSVKGQRGGQRASPPCRPRGPMPHPPGQANPKATLHQAQQQKGTVGGKSRKPRDSAPQQVDSRVGRCPGLPGIRESLQVRHGLQVERECLAQSQPALRRTHRDAAEDSGLGFLCVLAPVLDLTRNREPPGRPPIPHL